MTKVNGKKQCSAGQNRCYKEPLEPSAVLIKRHSAGGAFIGKGLDELKEKWSEIIFS